MSFKVIPLKIQRSMGQFVPSLKFKSASARRVTRLFPANDKLTKNSGYTHRNKKIKINTLTKQIRN